ncbi:MAG: ABC transporter permease [Desulfomonilaceae bacterium]
MRIKNVYHLGIKEIRSLGRDPIMMALIVFAFTGAIFFAGKAVPETLQNAPIAIVDEDRSALSARIIGSFYPPHFLPPIIINHAEIDERMDKGLDTFALNIPPEFQRDVLAGRRPTIQLNVDATRMSQAFTGSGYIQSIVSQEVQDFAQRYRQYYRPPVDLALRIRFNPNLNKTWFGSVMKVIDQVTMLAIVLTGAALIRERERGLIEHLLVMPVTPLEIMVSKIWSMGVVVLVSCALSLTLVVQGLLKVPIQGSVALFLCGTGVHLFAATALGIFLGTMARSMPQLGLLVMLILLPLQMLSGGMTPRESMPEWVQFVMLGAPTTHFVILAQGVLYRGAGFNLVWPQFVYLGIIGMAFFSIALVRFRKAISTIQ